MRRYHQSIVMLLTSCNLFPFTRNIYTVCIPVNNDHAALQYSEENSIVCLVA